jgi:hypothetical protein
MLLFIVFVDLSIVLNALLAVLVARRLAVHRQLLKSATGASPLVSWCSTIAKFMVQSTVAWVVAALLFVITTAVSSPASSFFEDLFQITAVREPAQSIDVLLVLMTYAGTQPRCSDLQNSTESAFCHARGAQNVQRRRESPLCLRGHA